MTHDICFVKGEYYAVSQRSSGNLTFYMLVKGWHKQAAHGASIVEADIIYGGAKKAEEERLNQRTWLRHNIVEKITDEAKICELKLRGLVL